MKIIHIFAINTHLEQQSIKYCHQYHYSPKIMIEGQKEQQYWKKIINFFNRFKDIISEGM